MAPGFDLAVEGKVPLLNEAADDSYSGFSEFLDRIGRLNECRCAAMSAQWKAN